MSRTSHCDLSAAVQVASQNEALLERLRKLYIAVDAEVARLPARCLGGGACCRFDLAGHRLYASTAELALLLTRPPVDPTRAGRMRCPYQRGRLCLARDVRPLGCRCFFCAEGASDPGIALYEQYHAQLRNLHEELSVDYIYTELTSGLREIWGIVGGLSPRKSAIR